MQRYFVNKIEDSTFTLSNDDTYHINKVMRMNISDKIEVVYDKRLFISEIIELIPYVKCRILNEVQEQVSETPEITIIQSLVKDNKLELIFQKSTELGVKEIVLYEADRSIVKIKDSNKKLERWNKIIKEASEQSKRLEIPKLEKIINLRELKKLNYDYKFLCTVNENTKTIKEELQNVGLNDRIIFVVGPEGGFTELEEKELIDSGFISISLGNNVLRTETASLFILSAVNYEFMR